MKTGGFAALVVTILILVPASARAQEAVQLDASVGLQGYVVPWEPATVSVRVQSDVLFVGDLQVTVGGVSLFTPIEVPASSTKQYDIDVPAVDPTSRVVVRLYVQGADEHLTQKSITVQSPVDEILVGVLGGSGVEANLAGVESVPFGRDLLVLSVTPEELESDIAPLGYLVVSPGALSGVGPDLVTIIADWVRAGGRLIGEYDDVSAVGMSGQTGAGETTAITALDKGELITVADFGATDGWTSAFRDTPPHALSESAMRSDWGFQMFEAATSGGESVTPGISWLLGALTVYVLIVGPVNFFVLRRLRRKELAWVTIPAISLVMLAVLWVAGQTHAANRLVVQASVVVQEDTTSRASSAMVVVAGAGGEHTIDAPVGWSLAPVDTSMMFGRSSGVEARVGAAPAGGTRLSFTMPDLGAATLTARWIPERLAVDATVVLDGDDLAMTVTNNSDVEFWAWGIGNGNTAHAAPGPLSPGETDSTTLVENAMFMEGGAAIGDAVMSREAGFWNDRAWQKVWPLSETAAREEGSVLRRGPYFFGYTDDLQAKVTVDGRVDETQGPSLVIIPLDAPAGTAVASGGATIMGVVGADWVDWYPGWLYASNADALEFSFHVDPSVRGDATVNPRGGQLPNIEAFEVFNWESGQFDEYGWRDDFPLAGHVSPTGELMARLTFVSAEWSDMNLADNSLTLEVGSA